MISTELKRLRLIKFCGDNGCDLCNQICSMSKYCKSVDFARLDKEHPNYIEDELVDKFYEEVFSRVIKATKFYKSELKTGMMVTLRNGAEYYVLRKLSSEEHMFDDDVSILYSMVTGEAISLDRYNGYLEDMENHSLDVVEVAVNTLGNLFEPKGLKVIYSSKDEKVKMTLKEIEKALGYAVEVVNLKEKEKE